MDRKTLWKIAAASFAVALLIFVFNYFFFHYFNGSGFGAVFHAEPVKPIVSDMVGQLGVHFLFASLFSLLVSFFVKKK